jgi:hypothetical protein
LFDVGAALPVRMKRRVEDQTRTVAKGEGIKRQQEVLHVWKGRSSGMWRYASLRSDRPDLGLLGTGQVSSATVEAAIRRHHD